MLFSLFKHLPEPQMAEQSQMPELPIGVEDAYAIICDPVRLAAHPSLAIMGKSMKTFAGAKSDDDFHMELPYDDIKAFLGDTKEKIYNAIPAGEDKFLKICSFAKLFST